MRLRKEELEYQHLEISKVPNTVYNLLPNQCREL